MSSRPVAHLSSLAVTWLRVATASNCPASVPLHRYPTVPRACARGRDSGRPARVKSALGVAATTWSPHGT
jgi:hypothetical protein